MSDAPAFEEAWHAQAFALTHHLADRGVFAWADWTEALAARIAARTVETPDAYYRAWVAALEDLVARAEPGAAPALADLRAAWERAYLTTPHGVPVRLDPSRP